MCLRYGWFCIRCGHFPMSMFLRLGNVGWYCVTKGSIFFYVHFCFSVLVPRGGGAYCHIWAL